MCHTTRRLDKYLKCFLGVVRVCQMIIIYWYQVLVGVVPIPVVDMVTAYRRCVSSVAGVGLQDLANRANQISVSN